MDKASFDFYTILSIKNITLMANILSSTSAVKDFIAINCAYTEK
jgi:hypothetical protein